jgi:hypothetical protein
MSEALKCSSTQNPDLPDKKDIQAHNICLLFFLRTNMQKEFSFTNIVKSMLTYVRKL